MDLTHPSIPSRLLRLYNQGYRIVIFSNEAAIGSAKPTQRKQAIYNKLRSIILFVNYMQHTSMYVDKDKRFVLNTSSKSPRVVIVI